MSLPETPTELPEPHTQYHCDPKYGEPIEKFTEVWIEAGEPGLKRVWRDPGGGWTRYLWFKDADNMCHALFTPSYWKSHLDLEKALLVTLVANIKEDTE